jgi:hypothetical protein
MSSQATVQSIDDLKEFRASLAIYGEDTLGALGAVEAEVRRTVRWLEEERPVFWHEQIKRRREQVSLARAEVFRRNLQKRPGYTPPMSEQKEALRKAEASLQEAEKRLGLVRKWQPRLKQAVLEYHGAVQRLKDLAAADVPAAVNLLARLVDALEAYLQVAPPTLTGLDAALDSAARPPAPAQFISIATRVLDEDAAAAQARAESRAGPASPQAETEAGVAPEAAVPAGAIVDLVSGDAPDSADPPHC